MSAHVAYLPDWSGPFTEPARYKSAQGGRGSSKSHTLAGLSVLRMSNLLPGYEPGPVRIASARQFQNSIKESVKVAVEHYIHHYNLDDEYDKQTYVIKNLRTGSHMWFPGFNRHPESLLSTEGMDVLWIEQAETIGEEMEKIIPTVRKPGSELWFSWNPQLRAQWCWKRFVINPRPGDVSVTVNWDNNPFWYPLCVRCRINYPFEMACQPCRQCGTELTTGLRELDEERLALKAEEPDRYVHVWGGMPDDGDANKQVLTYAVLQKCVNAYKEGLCPPLPEGVTDGGLDMAEGGADKCAYVGRTGPLIHTLDKWPGVPGNLKPAADRAHDHCKANGVYRLYYDGSTPIAGEFKRMPDLDYSVRAISFGGKVGGEDTLYETRRKNKDVFRSRNIQMADALRLRAGRTARLMDGQDIDPLTCLFIHPDLPDLEGYLANMTQPIRRKSPLTGKWELDKRGGDENAESPDDFDATCLAYCRDSDNGLRARVR